MSVASPIRGARTDTGAAVPDAVLVAALRARNESAYLTLVRRHTPLVLRVARSYVAGHADAEDVVQDTWMAVLRSVDRFEGRSTFTTWLMRILANTARSRRIHDGRTLCWGALPAEAEAWEAAASGRASDTSGPERRALSGEAWSLIDAALDPLPGRQRTVVVLRDLQDWTSEEVCSALGLSAGNQRVLLHRGRERLRELLADYADEQVAAAV